MSIYLWMHVCNSGTPQWHRLCKRLSSWPPRISSLSISSTSSYNGGNNTKNYQHNPINHHKNHKQKSSTHRNTAAWKYRKPYLSEALSDSSQYRNGVSQQLLLNVKNRRPINRENLHNSVGDGSPVHTRLLSLAGEYRTRLSGPNPAQIPRPGGEPVKLSVVKP